MVDDLKGAHKQRWYPDYQDRDSDIIHYDEFLIPGCDVKFRGPGFNPFEAEQGSFFSCIGSAHTYGPYFPSPYPTLLSKELGMPVLNLGVGGTGPGFYGQYDSLIEAMNRGRFVVLQCMAARQEANSRFDTDGHVEFVKDRTTGESLNSGLAWKRIVEEDSSNALRYVAETRLSWIETIRKLVERLTVPVIFLWFTEREMAYGFDRAAFEEQIRAMADGTDENYHVNALAGEFPHFIDEWTAEAVAALCDGRAECISSRGMGKPIVSQFTGEPIAGVTQEEAAARPELTGRIDGMNRYYPSPEMHEDAAAALLPVARKIMQDTTASK
ncbi:DUF6473 family protein [Sphingobium sp. AN558]|uniref:DUF6473 family protein n=1 Tax=Sphingobium sp. AN558 TaxID=3133442 RepID=UPI0030C3B114